MEPLTSEQRKLLIETARRYLKNSYSPYSNYPVGAAVLAEDGEVYGGANIENSAYPSGLCAERVAINRAISEGNRKILALAVVTRNAGAPCGACRQVIAEFKIPHIIMANLDDQIQTATCEELLPGAFSDEDM